MELAESKLGVLEVLRRFPGVVRMIVSFPFDQVFVLSVVRGPMVEDFFDFVDVWPADFYVFFGWRVYVCWLQECDVKRVVNLHALG